MTDALSILLVEDNPGDVLLTEEAFQASEAGHHLRVAKDGASALAGLRQDAVADELPDLILLDLNLPGMSGHEVLEEIKGDAVLGRLPVLMFTSSMADADVRRCYELHSNCYVCKPIDLDGYLEAVGAVERFWHSTVRLPARAGSA